MSRDGGFLDLKWRGRLREGDVGDQEGDVGDKEGDVGDTGNEADDGMAFHALHDTHACEVC